MAETPKTTKTTTRAKTAETPKEKAKAPTTKKAAAKPASSKSSATEKITAEKRYRMIAEAAYYRAQSHQFKSDPVRDWIEAEQEIDAMLTKQRC